jgi:HAD superfamily phosphatase (TIGR01668 family)
LWPAASVPEGGRLPILRPDIYYTTVGAIDLDALQSRGIRGVLLDMDNTLVPRDTGVIPPSARDFAGDLASRGIKACLVSNNWHQRVSGVAEDLGFSLVSRALKPLPFAFRKGMRLMGVEPHATATIGDQLFTDMLGGNLAGTLTVLVEPLSHYDLPHTLLLRLIEAKVMSDRVPLA